MHRMIRSMLWVIIMIAAAGACFADMTGENGRTIPSVSVTIPVKHMITGDYYSGDDEFTFVLTAEKEDTPMPEGSDGRTKEVTVTGDEDPDFGAITFSYPDTYYYTICQKDDNKNFSSFDGTYRVMIAMYNNGTSQYVVWDDNGSKTDEIVFVDEYISRSSPKTGDPTGRTEIAIYAAMGVMSLAALLILMINRRKGTAHEE